MSNAKFTAIATAFALAGFMTLTPAHASDEVRVVASAQDGIHGTLCVAQQLGYFAAEGLSVSMVKGSDGTAAIVSTLAGGTAQIGLVDHTQATQAVGQGASLQVVDTVAQGLPGDVVVRSDYLKQNPDIVAHYLRAIKRSEDLIRSNPQQAKAAYLDYEVADARDGAIDPASADRAWQNVLVSAVSAGRR